MIIRLHIRNYKNLKDVELYLGAFTCIAGVNGVGKSNLFDAIRFLSTLASKDNTLVDAALQVRDEKNKKRSLNDIKNLFFFNGTEHEKTIFFEADMILPVSGADHLGQQAKPTITSVRYTLELGFKTNKDEINQPAIEILKEELRPINKGEIKNTLKLMGFSLAWIESVITGTRQNATPFIETNTDEKIAYVSTDQKLGGKRKKLNLENLPRTILSSANSSEYPTMQITQNEITSWKLMQFEPSSLRSADDLLFIEKPKVTSSGEHLPATLYRLLNDKSINYNVKSNIENRLSELIDDVFEISVDRDEKRDILTLLIKSKNGNALPARSLSDGTLRFIALSIIQADPEFSGTICLEEPENGIHPERIDKIIRLLIDIATIETEPVSVDNPLRQVIINTHSPIVVTAIPQESLLFADFRSKFEKDVKFIPLFNTWRNKISQSKEYIKKGNLLVYLDPYVSFEDANYHRVIDRQEFIQLSLFNQFADEE
jgi:predicted ATPase